MISFPPCKINLGLNVIEKRSDGYHAIETCFYPVPWTDILEIIPAKELSFTSSGLTIPGTAEDNLCVKAYRLLKHDFNLSPVQIHLHKILPMGAGLGGGSSDAAHTLRLLNQLFALQLNADQLKMYAARLGSDCAFFIHDRPMLGTGRGEVLQEIAVDLSGKFMVLVNPQTHISTAEAYRGITPARHAVQVRKVVANGGGITHWRNELKNDFEEIVFAKHPELLKIRERLYASGATYAAMSGSGSTVFGIFEQPVELKKQFPDMTYWHGML
jgi:4-diphosphocytidyl-2-C-methyl-D-erythritol kinase